MGARGPSAADHHNDPLAAIVAAGRATRRRPSRRLWIAAAIAGALGALGFLLLVLGAEPRAPAEPARAPVRGGTGTGCAGGAGLGLGAGLAIGFALGRRRPAAGDR